MANHPKRRVAAKKATLARLAAAFNEWQRRFIANPADFESEAETIGRFVMDLNGGKTPSLGERQAAYLMMLMGSLP